MFLMGRVATADGTPVPNDVVVERVCNANVRQQVHATSRGDFSMQMGSMADSYLDATGDRSNDRFSQDGAANKDSTMGIPRRELVNCELRASVSGFYSSVISLAGVIDPGNKRIDVGPIVVQRRTNIEGMALSATPYKAPKEATRAYEKGLEAERNGKLANARNYFQKAVNIYPKFTNAWFQLGTVLQKENQKDAARTAFTQATTIDPRFLPPYLSLASMAYEAKNWTEVLNLTGHILDLDPLNHVTSYILDLDPLNYTEAYFYNAFASYKLNKIEDAEKSGLKAERLDLRTHFPQLHLLLAEIFARKKNYVTAISEIQSYLELVPRAKDADQVREWLAKLETLNGPVSTSEEPDQK
ncbi:MAG TPA: tetratricopeptide repeat protein [Candidatus Acidoferrum sp.]|nr:tetratricopeptide repeat protein [Candidatus Acidoferrum sp.]